jgi:predicted ribosome quality control (RQC) complex YloA/Tae2 family protein
LAIEALERAQKVLQRAGEKLAAALAKLEMLDPAVRERREAREAQAREAYQDQQRRIAASSAAAAAAHARGSQRGSVVTAHHQVQGPQEDDQERSGSGPDVPRM